MLLDSDTVPTTDQIYAVLESDEAESPSTGRLRAVIDECSSRWPFYDDSGDEVADAPWASWPLAGDVGLPVIELNIRWDHAKEMLPALVEIADRCGVVLYDPQEDQLHLPSRLA